MRREGFRLGGSLRGRVARQNPARAGVTEKATGAIDAPLAHPLNNWPTGIRAGASWSAAVPPPPSNEYDASPAAKFTKSSPSNQSSRRDRAPLITRRTAATRCHAPSKSDGVFAKTVDSPAPRAVPSGVEGGAKSGSKARRPAPKTSPSPSAACGRGVPAVS